MQLLQQSVHVGHEHQAPSAENGVERIGVELQRLSIGFDQIDVSESRCFDSLARNFEHPRRHINRYDAARRPDYASRGQGGLAAASCYIEHAMTGARATQFNQAIVDPLSSAFKSWPPLLPPVRGIIPRELLFVFHFQIVRILIGHIYFTVA